MSEVMFGAAFERPAAQAIADKLWPRSSVTKLTRYAHLDFAVTSGEGEITAFLEVKRRRFTAQTYDSTIVNWQKYDAAVALKKFLGARSLAIIVFDDNVGTFWLDETPAGKKEIIRRDRSTKPVEHALYNLTQFAWHPELLGPINEKAQFLLGK